MKTFPKISADEFIHLLDKDALEKVKKIPFLRTVTQKIFELGLERVYYIENMADNLKITPLQYPKIYKMLQQGCEILDISEPELYIDMNPEPNAYTYGVNKPFIVITSGLVELLEDDELLAVIGHELGHIKCQHVLYQSVLQILTESLEMTIVGLATVPLLPLKLALLDWGRKSEFSADRTRLLVTQNLDVCINVEMKLAGGSKKLESQLNKEEFMKQANSFSLDKDVLDKIYKFGLVIWRTHP
ncbi:MAG: M48 family metallopeptidase [Elusimicrobiota bacterium]